jgi:hypothetical protein
MTDLNADFDVFLALLGSCGMFAVAGNRSTGESRGETATQLTVSLLENAPATHQGRFSFLADRHLSTFRIIPDSTRRIHRHLRQTLAISPQVIVVILSRAL